MSLFVKAVRPAHHIPPESDQHVNQVVPASRSMSQMIVTTFMNVLEKHGLRTVIFESATGILYESLVEWLNLECVNVLSLQIISHETELVTERYLITFRYSTLSTVATNVLLLDQNAADDQPDINVYFPLADQCRIVALLRADSVYRPEWSALAAHIDRERPERELLETWIFEGITATLEHQPTERGLEQPMFKVKARRRSPNSGKI